MKKWLCCVFVFGVLLGCCVLCSQHVEASVEGCYTYEIVNGEAEITSCKSYVSGSLVIPSNLGGYPVTAIGPQAFLQCVGLIEVKMPSGITHIKDQAFYNCRSLTSIDIPDSVIFIGDSAFESCRSLKSISIPAGVVYIGNQTFKDCTELTSITIPDSVEKVGKDAFKYSGLKFNIYDGVAYLGTSTNPYHILVNTGVYSASIHEGTRVISGKAFQFYRGNDAIVIPDSVTYIGSYAFAGCGITSVTIGEGVRCIDDYAFHGCSDLTRATFGNGLESIGNSAFSGCSSLTNITLPNSVTKIGNNAFSLCKRLHTATIGVGVFLIDDAAFSNCYKLTNIYYPSTESAWNRICIGENNEYLINARLYIRASTFEINTQPESFVEVEGKTVKFSVATSDGNVNYCWKYSKDGGSVWLDTTLEGCKTDTLIVPVITSRNGYMYKCVITRDKEYLESEEAMLMVPYLVEDAKSQNVQIGEMAVFKVEYSVKNGVTYRWEYKGNGRNSVWANTTAIGNKTDTITVLAKSTNNRYMYRCKIIDPNIVDENGDVIPVFSKEVYLNIVEDEAVIIKNPQSNSGVCGTYVNFTVEATGDGLNYQWQWSNDGGETWANTKNKGYSTATLSVKTNNFNSGYMYRCVVKTFNGSAWNKVYSEPATMTVTPAAEVIQLPYSVTAKIGENATISVDAEGAGLKYQWQWAKNLGHWMNTNMEGATTNTLTIPVTPERNGRYFRVVITNSYGGYIETRHVQLIAE